MTIEMDRSFLEQVDLVSLIEQRAPTRFGRPYGTGEKRTVKGSCPWCGGTDRFAVFVNDIPQRYKCGIHGTGCGAHGDAIDFLRQHEQMTFQQSVAFLHGDLEALKINPHHHAHTSGFDYTSEKWQRQVVAFVKQAEADLWADAGADVLGYLWQRGFEDTTIQSARLGAATYKDKRCLVIPWYDGKKGIYTRVTMRDINATGDQKRYTMWPSGSNESLYGATRLNRPIILVEGEIDALTIAQAISEITDEVAVVATGSTGANRTVKPLMRLSASPHVFVAFDAEARGEQGATYWLEHLPNATRWHTPIGKDANECFLHGVDLKAWVQVALSTLADESEIEPAPIVMSPVERIARKVFGEGGYTITLVPMGYTHAQRIADLELHPLSLDMFCSSCKFNRASVLWMEGKPYCRRCQEAEKAHKNAG